MAFLLLIIIQVIFQITLQGILPVVSLYADLHHASGMVIGLLFSVYALFPMLFALRVGKLLDRVGAKKMVIWGGEGLFLALLIPVIFPGIYTLLLSQAIIGMAQTFIQVAIQKTVGNLPGNKDKLIANLTFANSGGGLVGPVLSGFVFGHFKLRITFGLFLVLTLLAIILCYVVKRQIWMSGEKRREEKDDRKNRSTWKMLSNINLRNALIISGLVLFSKNLFTAYFPVYAHHLGMSASLIGVFLGINAGMAMLIRFFQFQLVKALGRLRILLITLLTSGVVSFLLPFTHIYVLLGVICALLGGGLGLGQPLSLVYALNSSPLDRQGEVLGLRLTFNRSAQFFAPLLFGEIASIATVSSVFWVCGVLLFCGGVFSQQQRRRISPEKDWKA